MTNVQDERLYFTRCTFYVSTFLLMVCCFWDSDHKL